uniref:Tick transposon n=1 Tax=Angiostrongylus cantonensis TaxID=6313 RepID=A0A158PBH2_ANGCA
LNHVVCTRNCVISNNRKLKIAASKGQISDELMESTRDQGFVRPTILILCPFKKDAFDIVQRLELLVFGKGSLVYQKSSRFSLSKKVLKLYEAFDKVRYLKPLRLFPYKSKYFFSASHQIIPFIMQRADIMLQQNWEHLSIIFSHLHNQPSEIHTDISRVRKCYIDGMSKYYCQLLLFSRYAHELFSALILEYSLNYHGLVIQNRPCNGTLDKIEIPLCQELRRFAVENAAEQAVLRFNFFKEYVRTCFVIPSYFDFVRVRNYFKRTEESFVACHEYAPRNKITRARDMFYHKMKKILLVTERYYYFNRKPLRGIAKIVFYQLPSHPDFYCEFINMANCEAGTRFSSVLFYCLYDRIRLQNTFGTDLANSIISSKKTVQAIVSE